MDIKIQVWLLDISDEIIWAIIHRELPILKAEVHDLLS